MSSWGSEVLRLDPESEEAFDYGHHHARCAAVTDGYPGSDCGHGKIAPAVSVYGKDLFSLEMWGGATFDTSFRFLGESPWERLDTLRGKIPNLLFQMLIRGANGVGYKNYPDNVIRNFVRQSAEAGIDLFRIFDSLNWIPGMEVALDETLNQGKLAETCICYTGDILDESRTKYNLSYVCEDGKRTGKTRHPHSGNQGYVGPVKTHGGCKTDRCSGNRRLESLIHFTYP